MSTSTRLGRQLEAPAPTWNKSAAVVVVGGGAAGLSAALPLAAARIPVVLVCRSTLLDTATARSTSRGIGWRNPPTSEQLASAGDGLTDPAAAGRLIEQAPELLDWLDALAHQISSVEQDPRQPLGMTMQRTLASVARVQELLPAGTLTIDTHSRADVASAGAARRQRTGMPASRPVVDLVSSQCAACGGDASSPRTRGSPTWMP